jgi:pimeloyl-ACP methyl ester carboxylesterase
VQPRVERFRVPEAGGIALCAVHRGDPARPTVVLLHGGGANHHWWDPLAPALADRFHVVALDFRGHGDSDYPERRETGAFHRDLAALVRHLGRREVALVGHSLGGHVALHHAAAHGGVSTLVAIEVSRGGVPRERRRMRLSLAAHRSYRSREEAVRRYRFLPESQVPEPLRLAIAERSVRPLGDGRFGFKFDPRWFLVPPTPPPDLAQVRCACLVVRGGDSALLTREGAQALAAELPDARVLEIPGCGHNVQLERGPEVAEAVRAHLLAHARVRAHA